MCLLFVFIFDFACINFLWYLTMFILSNLLYSFISHFPVYLLYSFILPYWIKLLFSLTLSCLIYIFSSGFICRLTFIYFILPDITLNFISNCYLPHVFSVIIYLILLMYLLSSFILSCWCIYFHHSSHPADVSTFIIHLILLIYLLSSFILSCLILLMIAYTALFSALLSRLTALACDSTRVTSFL